MRCIECGAPLEITNDPMKVEFRGERLTIRGIEHYRCVECGEDVLDSKMNDAYNCAVDQEYRIRCGLLSPDEIKAFRKSLGLTQEQFQVLLGVGKLSACRWETGRLVQSKTVDNLMRAYMSCPRLVNEALERAELGSVTQMKRSVAVSPLEDLSEYLALPSPKEEAVGTSRYCAAVPLALDDTENLFADEKPTWSKTKRDSSNLEHEVAA